MKLEVGMYVKTKSFEGFPSKIGKITKVEYNAGIDNETYIALDNDEESCRRWTKDWLIGEPSHNIIDLIEEGDYVNGYPIKSHFGSNAVCLDINYQKQGIGQIVKEQDIKSIVTKEKFSQIQYKVGD